MGRIGMDRGTIRTTPRTTIRIRATPATTVREARTSLTGTRRIVAGTIGEGAARLEGLPIEVNSTASIAVLMLDWYPRPRALS